MKLPWPRRRREAELDEEIRSHLAEAAREHEARGESREEAVYAARREFGNVTLITELTRRMWGGVWLDQLLQDLRVTVRGLRRTPAFTIAVVGCFALGIGVNSVMFGVVDALFLRAPAGVADPGRVGRLYSTAAFKGRSPHTRSRFTIREYAEFRDALAPIASLAGYWGADVAVGRGADAEHVTGGVATASLLPLLGARLELGRFFDSAADNPGATPEAVISYGYWTRRFLSRRSALGQSVRVGGHVYTVIGVTQKAFGGIDLDPVDIWLPLGPAAPDLMEPIFFSGMNAWLTVVARLRTGAAPQAVEQATTLALQRRSSDIQFRNTLGPLQGARGPMRQPETAVLVWAALLSIVVLIIACANVAALQLGRAVTRRREYAVRLALGAGRGRLLTPIVVENALLSLAGACIAVAVAINLGATTQTFLLPGAHALPIVASSRMIVFSCIVAVVAGVASGILPALQSSRTDQRETLADPRGPTRLRYGGRRIVLVGQVALTLTLLIMAGLFVRSGRNAHGIDLGFEPNGLLVVTLDLQNTGRYQGPALIELYKRLLDRVQRMPQVQHASLSQGSPLESAMAAGVFLPGQPVPRGAASQFLYPVSPGFLQTMGMRLLRGRGLLEADGGGSQPVALVNEALAREVWPSEDPVGRCFRFGDSPCVTVVGVVANTTAFGITDQARQLFYLPLEQGAMANDPDVTLEVRTTGRATDAIGPLRRELIAADPDLPYVNVRLFSDRIESQLRPWTLGSTMFTAYGVLALLLSGLGLYGLLTYTVAQRNREIGIRMALGAESRSVQWMVVSDGLKPALVGVLIGAAGGLGLGRGLASLLYGVPAFDGWVLGAGTGTLMVVALAASYLPGRRATRIDPNVALRGE